jgi:hypothetical protein
MRSAPLPFRHEVAFLDEFLQAQLHGAGFAFGELHDLAEREGFVIGEEGDDLFRERVEVFGAGVFEAIFLASASFCFTRERRKKTSQASQSGLSELSVVWVRRRAR